jgi:DamX protein
MGNTPDTADLADRIASLSDALDRYRLEFQQAENSLVTRIADVDDDRRLTTNRLQRAWQTHRDEIDARQKHQASVFAGTLLLIAILLGGTLFFAYGQLDAARRTLVDDVARLRIDYEQLAAVTAQDAALKESLASLRATVAALSESLPPRSAPADTRVPAVGADGSDASPVDEVPSTPTEGEPEPTAEAMPETSPSAAAIQDATAAPPPENLDGQDAAQAPEAVPAGAPPSEETPTTAPVDAASAPPEDRSPAIPATAAPVVDNSVAQTPGASVRIADEPLVVGSQPYALQLIGFYSIDAMLDFARREELPSRVYFREESYQGRPWFVLIHSLYARYSDASDTIAELPTELAILDTWIRNFPAETRLGILEIER